MLDKNDLLQIGQLLDEKLDEKLDPIIQRLNSIEEEIADIKITLERIDKRTDEDIKATYIEIEKLKSRISELESQVKLLKVQKA